MKLNNIIILTIYDFRRHFNFPAFWNSRLSFVRDMEPDQMYYFEEEDKKNYEKIVLWIKAERDGVSNSAIRQSGLTALSLFAKCNVTEKDWRKAIGMLDFSADIIVVEGGGMLKLPGQNMTAEEATEYSKKYGSRERLHKVEVEGDINRTATVFIGGTEVAHLKSQECLYVTEIDGCFLRALPNRLRFGPYVLSLENIPGKFESTLLEEYYAMGCTEIRHEGVTQFSYDKNKKPIFASGNYYTINY